MFLGPYIRRPTQERPLAQQPRSEPVTAPLLLVRVRYDSGFTISFYQLSVTPLSASLLFPKPTGFYFGQIYRGVRKVQVLF
jgi:hypothetical protein